MGNPAPRPTLLLRRRWRTARCCFFGEEAAADERELDLDTQLSVTMVTSLSNEARWIGSETAAAERGLVAGLR